MNNIIATIMCVYSGDRADHLEESIDSILNQSFINHDLYLLINGEISSDTEKVIEKYKINSNFFAVFLDKNIGLAKAMNYLLDNYVVAKDYSYIARMDADDICSINRFKKQVNFLIEHPEVAIVGSDCIEIDDAGNEIGYKKMEVNDFFMKKNIIKRCPFNHPSVMVRAKVFESGCRYNPQLKNTQDYYLWVDLISKGYVFSNINEALIKFRITDSFYKKRGREKALNDFKGRVYAMNKLKIFTIKNLVFTLGLYCLRLSPVFVSKLAYKFLR
jgi:glycosyltransferase involved in cell wall biosynthesis